ncbi:MAG: hypothetical protein Q4F49_00345 [Pseudoxanthomonas suwonensis]|nr:hypothetical protein [Pseudoxanthomonas suwonensis]
MNAIATNNNRPGPTSLQKLGWLLRREFWEHRGGFLWAPLIAGGVFLFFTLLGGGTAQVVWNKARLDPGNTTTINGVQIPTSEVRLADILQSASAEDLRQMGEAVNAMTLMTTFWPLVVFGFVAFFYLLGALYDERKDRSVLFWKSLPVSDGLTVWSKLLMALVVAPLLATMVALAVMLAFGAILSGFILFNGGNPFTLYWAHLRPLELLGATFAALPIYLLWALPTAGWLLLCSAWARSKPFLWAVLVPLLAGAVVSWFRLFDGMTEGAGAWFWKNVVGRLLTGTWPGSHLLGYFNAGKSHLLTASEHPFQGAGLASGWHLFAEPQLWIGAAAGIAMVLLAIRLRRWRDEG